ncbi:hypothetical protein GGE16_004330 [Rhizobium leguminosarum]|uniref:Uncharacterized protein n=1 Tax=Rhizobium leguminosarum TaxID=384 RepID=A0AAE2MN41_RHILE|nr:MULTISPECIES: hypothetical protein [Rhizobium]MBB4292254.1 hypothetical protein [Rhizobium leguminosarum]MBB4299803.1 hypothetical protein [Rhizobium leguminosarum]MBB4309808.1 hypothetical protein [Rhizobium leguminosarum]MBB4419452.1 hypothetical protein [Rhizobium leguminosarum]MBB4434255.1 hypothetical protein [Rhizobium esperanzae]
MSCCSENPFIGTGKVPFNPSEVRLYGRNEFCPPGKEAHPPQAAQAKPLRDGEFEAGSDKIKLKVGNCYILIDPGKVEMVSIGVIYGYAYEGHCYKLPKPRIMYLPVKATQIPHDDCGCDCGYSPALGYSVWSLDKLERVIALDVRSDDIKTLILDENLPGNRSPLAYAQTQSLAPQRLRD